MHQRNAASVLPLPVGADIRVCWPAATDRQPPSWTSVGAGKAPENQARAAGENKSRTVGIGLSLLPRVAPSKPEVLQQFLGAHVAPCGEDCTPLFEQSGVVRCRAPDPLAQRHDLAVEVVELAARTAPETLQGRWPVHTVGWEIAGQPLLEHEVAERHGKGRHQTKRACPATLIETEATKLGGPHTFANRRNR